ncbi:MAG: transporter substrate-binding protein [Actinomycetia bacterium]|nr:transporter substrate-binding protein [Actinomycetes bacterium]MDQ1656773.1 basic rane protein [Cryptosporangiaceae bacterium]
MRLAAFVAVGAMALAACGNTEDPGSATSSSKGGLAVGLAYDIGGRGDKSFNDSAANGLDKAKKELGATAEEVSPNQAGTDRADKLKGLVDSKKNPVIAVGFKYADDLKKVAAANLGTNFAIVDDGSIQAPNVANILFAEEQGSYLVGVAAALKSKAKHVGFVGGVQSPLIQKFQAGFQAGVKSVDPAIKVDVQYLTAPPDFGGFAAPAKGKVAAKGMIDSGADVVYHAAGGSGSGVFDAVVEARAAGKAGTWAIGVDQDQYLTANDSQKKVILTSMIKRVDVGVFDFLKKFKDGEKPSGPQVNDLKSGGVDYATSGGYVDDIKDKIEAAKKDIIDGKVTVPAKP